MVFAAKGKLIGIRTSALGFGKRITKIRAEMHEGFFGTGHVVDIVIDKKFAEDVTKNLKRTSDRTHYPDAAGFMTSKIIDKFGKKEVSDHTIEIIIK